MDCCKKDILILYKGYPSKWDNIDWLAISFKGKSSLAGFSAKFKIGDFSFISNDLTKEWIINLNDEQTGLLPLGKNIASLIVYDTEGNGKPFTTSLPVLVKNWVEGDIEIDTFNVQVNATLDNIAQFTISVESGRIDASWLTKIDGYSENDIQTLKNINGVFRWMND